MKTQNPDLKIMESVIRIIICLVFFIMFYTSAFAQYIKLLDFSGAANGSKPYGALISDGTFLYGMTFRGGKNDMGVIFKIKPDGTGYEKLLDFDSTKGLYPNGSLIFDGTFLYGMARMGGTYNLGTIIKIKPDGSGYKKLLDFDSVLYSYYPNGTLIFDGKFLYGVIYHGGKNDMGIIFKIKPDGSGYKKLLDFDGVTTGRFPYGPLIFDGTFLYGMTLRGGKNGMGVIFKIKPDGSGYEKLLDFDGVTTGEQPYSSLIYDGTFLYGTTFRGGKNNLGVIFKIKPDGTGYIKILDFAGATNGAWPYSSLIYDGTFLYGMTWGGGTYGYGTIFKIKPDGTDYVKLFEFDGGINGGAPYFNSALISDGTFLYGMANWGGKYNSGVIFKYCLHPTFSTQSMTACDSYSWNGKVYTVSGTYTDTILNAVGCDSIMTLNLTIKTATGDSVLVSSCKTYESPSGKYTWDSTGYYTDTIPNSKGCDSVLSIHFIRTFFHDTVFVKSCDTVISPSGRYIYRSTGIYTDTLRSSQNCDSIITTNVTIKPLLLHITKSNDISCDTPYAVLTASGGDFYRWEPSDGLSDANSANPVATPDATRTYYVTATNSFGCSLRDSIVVYVEKKDSLGFVPNVFTPNNDGYNDCFEVSLLTEFKDIELTVFNRWGNIVFSTTDPKACWKGKDLSGKALSSGVYFYLLSGRDHCNEKINRQGTVTLIR